jgi:hypothetical protein
MSMTKQAAMPREYFCDLIVTLAQHVVPLYLQWPLAQLFTAAWASSTQSIAQSIFLRCLCFVHYVLASVYVFPTDSVCIRHLCRKNKHFMLP